MKQSERICSCDITESEQAKEILEMHFGSDFWKILEQPYFENIINAMIEFKECEGMKQLYLLEEVKINNNGG